MYFQVNQQNNKLPKAVDYEDEAFARYFTLNSILTAKNHTPLENIPAKNSDDMSKQTACVCPQLKKVACSAAFAASFLSNILFFAEIFGLLLQN